MRILIFSVSEKAVALQADLAEDGVNAPLRNPQHFSAHPSQYEDADKVFCESDEIEAVYKERGKEVNRLDKTNKVTSVKATTRSTKKTKKAAPKKKAE